MTLFLGATMDFRTRLDEGLVGLRDRLEENAQRRAPPKPAIQVITDFGAESAGHKVVPTDQFLKRREDLLNDGDAETANGEFGAFRPVRRVNTMPAGERTHENRKFGGSGQLFVH